jgi:hypothetical protein
MVALLASVARVGSVCRSLCDPNTQKARPFIGRAFLLIVVTSEKDLALVKHQDCEQQHDRT